jgi:hypothetical protein
MLYITVHPESVARPILDGVDLVLAVGESPERTIAAYCQAVGDEPPPLRPVALESGETLAWRRGSKDRPVKVVSQPPRSEHSRHSRKYAEGDLGAERSFKFRGPEGKLNLRAQNLVVFLQMAEGVDDETWLHHLRRGDYSAWFRKGIKDDALGEEVGRIESEAGLSAADSRAAIRDAVERRYTLPGEPAPAAQRTGSA